MSDDPMPELIAVWRAAMNVRGMTTRDVDQEAGLCDGYMAKILCRMRVPTWPTVAKINGALRVGTEFALLPH